MYPSQKHIFTCALLLASHVLVAQSQQNEPISVSLVQLLATPERFQGKQVRVIGFIRIEFEGSAIFLHREDHKYHIYKNALEIGVPTWAANNPRKYSNHYALIEGTFDSTNQGHMGLYNGSIRGITRISPIPKPAP